MEKLAESFDGHITVALAAYNREDTIEEAVRSLLEQTYGNFDLFVVDDASKDRTLDIVLDMLSEDRRLHVIELKENGGTYSAKNLVLKRFCRGEFYAHQDADDISWPRRLEAQVAFLRSHPEVAACGTGIDEFYKSDQDKPGMRSSFNPEFNEADGFFHRKNLYEPIIPQGLIDLPDNYVRGCLKICMNGSLLCRSEAVKKLGGFDGRTPIGADAELLVRLLLFYDLGNLQEILYSRRIHQSSLTQSTQFGYQSSFRANYFNQLFGKLISLRPFLETGEMDKVLSAVCEDMYSKNAEYKIYHGDGGLTKSFATV